jgi:hypothetical protein
VQYAVFKEATSSYSMAKLDTPPSSHPDSRISSRANSPDHKASPARARRPPDVRRATWAVILIAAPCVVQAAVYLRYLLRLIAVRNETGYAEGVGIYGFLTTFHTGRLYLPPFEFPWNAQIYGPLFQILGAFFAQVFHGDPMPITIVLREISFASLVGALAIVGYLSWRFERRKTWVTMTVIIALACSWLAPTTSTARPDLPATFLILASLTACELAGEASGGFLVAGVLAAAAFLMKQTVAPLVLALFLERLWTRRFKNAAAFVVGGVAAALPILGYLWLRREPFLENFLSAGHAIRDWTSVPRAAWAGVLLNQIVVIGLCIALLGAAASWRNPRYRRVLLLTAFAWVFGVAGLANLGASSHYFILPWLLSMTLVPAGLNLLERWAERRLWIPAVLALVAAAIVIHQKSLLQVKPRGALDTSALTNLKVLSEIAYLEARTREPQLLDPFFYNELSKQKVWSDGPVRHKIDTEDYDLLLIAGKDGSSVSEFLVGGYRGNSLWSAAEIEEMRHHYRPLCETAGYLALVPLDRASPLISAQIAGVLNQPCRASSRLPHLSPGYT